MDRNIKTKILFMKKKVRKKWKGRVHTYKKSIHGPLQKDGSGNDERQ